LIVGCLVPMSFDSKIVDQLKAANTLKVEAVKVDSAEPISFEISLRGFGSAIARTAVLSAD
jgi:invasion protein IalB